MHADPSSHWKEFDDNKVTHSAAHYLFAIEDLHDENGYARAVDIARKLDITPGSCSVGLKSLLKKEFILEDENRFIRLSESGSDIVKDMHRNREVFTVFFREQLWVKEKEAVINACKIEHLISSNIGKKLEKFLKK